MEAIQQLKPVLRPGQPTENALLIRMLAKAKRVFRQRKIISARHTSKRDSRPEYGRGLLPAFDVVNAV
jgi:hypothetical protein